MADWPFLNNKHAVLIVNILCFPAQKIPQNLIIGLFIYRYNQHDVSRSFSLICSVMQPGLVSDWGPKSQVRKFTFPFNDHSLTDSHAGLKPPDLLAHHFFLRNSTLTSFFFQEIVSFSYFQTGTRPSDVGSAAAQTGHRLPPPPELAVAHWKEYRSHSVHRRSHQKDSIRRQGTRWCVCALTFCITKAIASHPFAIQPLGI